MHLPVGVASVPMAVVAADTQTLWKLGDPNPKPTETIIRQRISKCRLHGLAQMVFCVNLCHLRLTCGGIGGLKPSNLYGFFHWAR